MAIVKAYKLHHPLLGQIALVFVVGYKNVGGYLRAESHVIFEETNHTPYSNVIRFEDKPPQGGALEITEELMADLALDEAKSHIEGHISGLSELQRNMLSMTSLSVAEPKDILQAWVRQKFPQLHDLSFKTESNDLKSYIQSFTRYPIIKTKNI